MATDKLILNILPQLVYGNRRHRKFEPREPAMLIHRKFMLTGQDAYGNKAVVETDSRDLAYDLVTSWKESGFIDVKMIAPKKAITPKTEAK
jgi:hypothetical protein